MDEDEAILQVLRESTVPLKALEIVRKIERPHFTKAVVNKVLHYRLKGIKAEITNQPQNPPLWRILPTAQQLAPHSQPGSVPLYQQASYPQAPGGVASGLPPPGGMGSYPQAPGGVASGLPPAGVMGSYPQAPGGVASGLPPAGGMGSYPQAPGGVASGLPPAGGMGSYPQASGLPSAEGVMSPLYLDGNPLFTVTPVRASDASRVTVGRSNNGVQGSITCNPMQESIGEREGTAVLEDSPKGSSVLNSGTLPCNCGTLHDDGEALSCNICAVANNKALPITEPSENTGTSGLNVLEVSTKSPALGSSNPNLSSPMQKEYLNKDDPKKAVNNMTTPPNNLMQRKDTGYSATAPPYTLSQREDPEEPSYPMTTPPSDPPTTAKTKKSRKKREIAARFPSPPTQSDRGPRASTRTSSHTPPPPSVPTQDFPPLLQSLDVMSIADNKDKLHHTEALQERAVVGVGEQQVSV